MMKKKEMRTNQFFNWVFELSKACYDALTDMLPLFVLLILLLVHTEWMDTSSLFDYVFAWALAILGWGVCLYFILRAFIADEER